MMGGGPDGLGGVPIGGCRRMTGEACTKKDWSGQQCKKSGFDQHKVHSLVHNKQILTSIYKRLMDFLRETLLFQCAQSCSSIMRTCAVHKVVATYNHCIASY
jgi:hypothetical protein